MEYYTNFLQMYFTVFVLYFNSTIKGDGAAGRQMNTHSPESGRCNIYHTEDTCEPHAENYGKCCTES